MVRAVAVAVAVLAVLGAVAVVLGSAPWRYPVEACLDPWRSRDLPPTVGEGPIGGDWGWFPAGVTCTWSTEDGPLVQGPGWDVTVVVVLLLAVAVGATVRAVLALRRLSLAGRV